MMSPRFYLNPDCRDYNHFYPKLRRQKNPHVGLTQLMLFIVLFYGFVFGASMELLYQNRLLSNLVFIILLAGVGYGLWLSLRQEYAYRVLRSKSTLLEASLLDRSIIRLNTEKMILFVRVGFITPYGREIHCGEDVILKPTAPLPERGTRMRVIYLNDENYRVL